MLSNLGVSAVMKKDDANINEERSLEWKLNDRVKRGMV